MRINREALLALQELNGLSGSGLARKAGLSQSHYSNICTGVRDPSPQAAKKIADALGVTVAALRLEAVAEAAS